MLSLSSLEGFKVASSFLHHLGTDESTAAGTPSVIGEALDAKCFYIVQSQHPLTSAEVQTLPPPQSAKPPPVVRPPSAPAPLIPPVAPIAPPPPAPELLQPPWLKELLSYRTPNKRPIYVQPRENVTCSMIKSAEDNLCVALLRAIDLLHQYGPVKSKLKLNRMGPPCELKELINHITDLAISCFENLPPFFACVKPWEVHVGVPPVDPMLDNNQMMVEAAEMCMQPKDAMMMEQQPTPRDNGVAYEMPSMMDCYTYAPFPGANPAYPAWSEPPASMMMMPPAPMPPASMPPPETGDWNQQSMYPYFHPPPFNPFGLQYHRLSDARRKCGFDGADLFPAGGKKGPAVGDRPLTPPAQGWYAKYSSGVTGVVWDRVHQAWVVSWTLAGKRTFRHFTCKSYGGFDKAREAAIEFRLARNREIAAYNKRCKDKK